MSSPFFSNQLNFQQTICEKCAEWKEAIFRNHNNKGLDIHWDNCQPHLWPTDKWEVAKVSAYYLTIINCVWFILMVNA